MNKINKPCDCEHCDFRDVVFSTLNDQNVIELCDNKEERSFRKGEIINQEGERITYFKYLKSGLAKLYRTTSGGEEQIIAITRPLEFVSNLSIFSGDRYKYSVSALEDSVVCCVKIEFIRKLFMDNSKFALELMGRISAMNDKIISQTLEIRQKNLAGRVALVILYLMNDVYKSRIFEIPVSRKEISDYIGMSTANVIRTISEFRREGLIKVEGKTIEVINKEKLEIISIRG